jgi:hypothetical protein
MAPFVFISLNIAPARANDIDVMVPMGEAVSGTVAGKGADIYKMFVGSGNTLAITLEGSAVSQFVGLGRFGCPYAPADSTSGPEKITVYTPAGVDAVMCGARPAAI